MTERTPKRSRDSHECQIERIAGVDHAPRGLESIRHLWYTRQDRRGRDGGQKRAKGQDEDDESLPGRRETEILLGIYLVEFVVVDGHVMMRYMTLDNVKLLFDGGRFALHVQARTDLGRSDLGDFLGTVERDARW